MEVQEQFGIEWLKRKGVRSWDGRVERSGCPPERVAKNCCHPMPPSTDRIHVDDGFCLDHRNAVQVSHFLLTVWPKKMKTTTNL